MINEDNQFNNNNTIYTDEAAKIQQIASNILSEVIEDKFGAMANSVTGIGGNYRVIDLFSPW